MPHFSNNHLQKVEMQLLGVPHHYEDMLVSASLTGVTILKKAKFKSRHAGSKEIIQKPVEGLMLRKSDQMEIDRLKKCKKKKKAVIVDGLLTVKKINKERKYTINKKEISHRIRNMVNQMAGEKKLFFWTITFPEKTNDDTAFILLNKWLTRLRQEKMLRSYLWISERQKNGTIHFHIAIHQRICVQKANKFMRACIMHSINNGEINYSRIEAKNYNGVDISKNRKTRRVTNFAQKKNEKSLINYITKYVSKNNESFNHLAWHSSRDYSNLITAVRFTDKEYERVIFKQSISGEITFESEWFVFYKWIKEPPEILMRYLASTNQKALALLN
jgi:hypothetical protein